LDNNLDRCVWSLQQYIHVPPVHGAPFARGIGAEWDDFREGIPYRNSQWAPPLKPCLRFTSARPPADVKTYRIARPPAVSSCTLVVRSLHAPPGMFDCEHRQSSRRGYRDGMVSRGDDLEEREARIRLLRERFREAERRALIKRGIVLWTRAEEQLSIRERAASTEGE
jgi:hypothetical protein